MSTLQILMMMVVVVAAVVEVAKTKTSLTITIMRTVIVAMVEVAMTIVIAIAMLRILLININCMALAMLVTVIGQAQALADESRARSLRSTLSSFSRPWRGPRSLGFFGKGNVILVESSFHVILLAIIISTCNFMNETIIVMVVASTGLSALSSCTEEGLGVGGLGFG